MSGARALNNENNSEEKQVVQQHFFKQNPKKNELFKSKILPYFDSFYLGENPKLKTPDNNTINLLKISPEKYGLTKDGFIHSLVSQYQNGEAAFSDKIDQLLKNDDLDIFESDTLFNYSMLHWLAYFNFRSTAEKCIQGGMSEYNEDTSFFSSKHLAAFLGNEYYVMRRITSFGIPESIPANGTPFMLDQLCFAILNGKLDMLNAMLKYKFDEINLPPGKRLYKECSLFNSRIKEMGNILHLILYAGFYSGQTNLVSDFKTEEMILSIEKYWTCFQESKDKNIMGLLLSNDCNQDSCNPIELALKLQQHNVLKTFRTILTQQDKKLLDDEAKKFILQIDEALKPAPLNNPPGGPSL